MFMDFIRFGLMTVGDTAGSGNAGAGAGGEGGTLGGSPWFMIIYIVAIIALMYFLMIRPNKKKEKKKKDMLEQMKKGDRITTIGGIQGKIAQIKDESIVIEVANLGEAEKVKIEIQKWAIGSVDSTDSAD